MTSPLDSSLLTPAYSKDRSRLDHLAELLDAARRPTVQDDRHVRGRRPRSGTPRSLGDLLGRPVWRGRARPARHRRRRPARSSQTSASASTGRVRPRGRPRPGWRTPRRGRRIASARRCCRHRRSWATSRSIRGRLAPIQIGGPPGAGRAGAARSRRRCSTSPWNVTRSPLQQRHDDLERLLEAAGQVIEREAERRVLGLVPAGARGRAAAARRSPRPGCRPSWRAGPGRGSCCRRRTARASPGW